MAEHADWLFPVIWTGRHGSVNQQVKIAGVRVELTPSRSIKEEVANLKQDPKGPFR
jgi:hypothetical protein